MNNEKLKFSDIKEMLDRGEMKRAIGGLFMPPDPIGEGGGGTNCASYSCDNGKKCPSGCACNSSETNPCV